MSIFSRLRKLAAFSPAMFAIALPVMLQSAVEYIFVFTDTAFIGHYDQAGLSAINNVMAPFFTVLSFFFALCQGITIIISQKIGARRLGEARRYAETAFFFMTGISLLIGGFWLIFGREVLALMGARDHILDMGSTYIRLLSMQFLSLGCGATAASIFQALGKTVPVMVSVIVKSLLNILLNWLLIFGNWGFPELGIAGSAIGTAISSILLDVLLVVWLFRGPDGRSLRLRFRSLFRPLPALFAKVLQLGIPVGAEYILWSLGQAVIIAMINRQDSFSSGHFGVLSILIMLSIQFYNGIGVATLVLIGQATGAKRHSDVRQIANYGMIFAQLACLVVGTLFMVIPDQLLSLFMATGSIRQSLIPLMYLSALIMFCKALNILAGNSIRGTGNTVWMLITQAGGTILIISASAVFLFGFGLGLTGLMLAVLIDELARGIINEIKFLQSQRIHHSTRHSGAPA